MSPLKPQRKLKRAVYVQLLEVSPLTEEEGKQKAQIRGLLSDGVHIIDALFTQEYASNFNYPTSDNRQRSVFRLRGGIIELKDFSFTFHFFKGRQTPVLLVNSFELLGSVGCSQHSNPTRLVKDSDIEPFIALLRLNEKDSQLQNMEPW